ncbi:hypothetical protein N3K63_07115 [Microbacterium sp. W1N]|uniref:hypothetical protein n=1 Tax=Microbacterium festucae TaxID=2977531 RepID=UPI0021BF526F|nr:hypothetical protein [Microbacterium festucae]MCT9820056.1 hypothetical protein [Microbacterium festucae]
MIVAVLAALHIFIGALLFGSMELNWYFHQHGISASWLAEAFRFGFTVFPLAVLAAGIVLAVRAWLGGRRAFWYALGGFVGWVLVAGAFMAVSTLARLNS